MNVLEYLKVLVTWPLVALIGLLIFNRQIRAILVGLRALLDRVKKLEGFGLSAEVGEQLLSEATPAPALEAASSEIELSVSAGAYSNDYHAIFLIAGVANRTDQQDQVVNWKLNFPKFNIVLEPSGAPPNLLGNVPWWPSPTVKLPPNELTRGSLYFRGAGALAGGLEEEPLHGKITATTLHGKTLSQDVEIYRLATLQAKTASA